MSPRDALPTDAVEVTAPRVREEDWRALAAEVQRAVRDAIYLPLAALLLDGVDKQRVTRIENAQGRRRAQSADDGLIARLRQGRITYESGTFLGRFNAASSRELKALGAKWDARRGGWRLSEPRFTPDIHHALLDAKTWTQRKLEAFDAVLRQIVPEKVAEKIQARQIFDTAIGKADKDISSSLKNIAVLPKMSPERREALSRDWATNMDRWVKGFVNDEIIRLRETVAGSTFGSGVRYEQLVSTLERQHGLSQRRAKFIARQETNLALSAFREQRYREAGSRSYRWQCVAGSPLHPVRPSHKALEGKIIFWDAPPITTEPGEPVRRNHAGQDYNCRCFPRVIIGRA